MVLGFGFYTLVSDWSWHTFEVCVWFIFLSVIRKSLFICIVFSMEFQFVDTSVLKKKQEKKIRKKKCNDMFVYNSTFHWAFIDIWGLFIRLSIIELTYEPFESVSLLGSLMLCVWIDGSLVSVLWDLSLQGLGLI